MLETIYVKNVALIEEAEVDLESGLTVFTGETGAGKSILLGSVSLALGAKADKNLIRKGAEAALVQLVFSSGDEQWILQRKITPTKTICKINDEIVTLKTLQTTASSLIDVHGQREHQTILKAAKQLELLDSYGGEDVAEALSSVAELSRTYAEEEKELASFAVGSDNPAKELDYLRYQYTELAEANLVVGEDDTLEVTFHRLSKAEKTIQILGDAVYALQGDSRSVTASFSSLLSSLSMIETDNPEIATDLSQLREAEVILSECASNLERYLEDLQSASVDVAAIEARLNLINRLKEKHGKKSVAELLVAMDTLAASIDKLEHYEERLQALRKSHAATKAAYLDAANHLHKRREAAGNMLSAAIIKELADLNFLQCQFEILVDFDETSMSQKGSDTICFLISLNPGEPLKPLSDVASGGELSRIMLAFKTIFADKEQTGTLVFDEIDAGISGNTAWKVAEKLAILRKRHQVLCITHLPQIAAMADTHYCIEKHTDAQASHTETTLTPLQDEAMLDEIARLVSGDAITEAGLATARELKENANKVKVET